MNFYNFCATFFAGYDKLFFIQYSTFLPNQYVESFSSGKIEIFTHATVERERAVRAE